MSETIYSALAKFYGQVKPITKDRVVDFVDKNGRRIKYSYADLASVIAAVRNDLSACGLSVSQRIGFENDRFGLITDLMHASGSTMTGFYPLPLPESLSPQAFGSLLTYARRYSFSSILGLATEEDDDGHAAESVSPSQLKGKEIAAQYATDKQIQFIKATAGGLGISDEVLTAYLEKAFGINTLLKLKKSDVNTVLAKLKDYGDAKSTRDL